MVAHGQNVLDSEDDTSTLQVFPFALLFDLYTASASRSDTDPCMSRRKVLKRTTMKRNAAMKRMKVMKRGMKQKKRHK
jgi:hypothetical protein